MENTRFGWGLSNKNSDDSGDADNISLHVATKGEYTFIYNYDVNGDQTYAKTISVIFPNTQFVAAGSEGLFGSDWSATDTNNQLTDTDDDLVYSLVKEGVELAEGNYEFKVVANSDWDNAAFPGSNKTIAIAKSGIYDVTITFNVLTQAVTAEAELKEEAVVLPTIAVRANWADGTGDAAWSDLELTADEGNLTASATKSFTATELGTYEFGVKVNGNWTSNGSGTTFSRTNNSVAVTGNSGNMNLVVDVVEAITFTWTYASNTLTVTYPELPETPVIAAAGTWNSWGTVGVFDVSQDGNTASWSRQLSALESSAGVYQFKIVKNGTMISVDGANNSEYEFKRDWNNAVVDGQNGTKNMRVYSDVTGTYTFTWEFATGKLTITYPELPAERYYVAGDLTDWSDTTKMARMSEAEGVWSATIALEAEQSKEFKIYRYQGFRTTFGAQDAENAMTSENCTAWGLASPGENIQLTTKDAGNYVFLFTAASSKLSVTYPDKTTGVENIQGHVQGTKILKNGVLYLMYGGRMYDVQGKAIGN